MSIVSLPTSFFIDFPFYGYSSATDIPGALKNYMDASLESLCNQSDFLLPLGVLSHAVELTEP